MESDKTLSIITQVLLIVIAVIVIIWLLYSLYYMNNNEKTETVWFLFRKPRKNKKRCPCGGHDPKSCKCKH